MAKSLLEIRPKDEDIYEAKIKLAEELVSYDKVKNNEQIKALVDFFRILVFNPRSRVREEEILELKKKI